MSYHISYTEKKFEPAPEGLHDSVCVDVVDKGWMESAFGIKPKVRLAWEIKAKREDGKPFLVSKTYTVSLHPKATLRQDLKAWRGREFTKEELANFDMEKLVGAPCRLLVKHDVGDDGEYSFVDSILKAAQPALKPSGGYKRVKDRDDWKAPARSSFGPLEEPEPSKPEPEQEPERQPDGDSDIPF